MTVQCPQCREWYDGVSDGTAVKCPEHQCMGGSPEGGAMNPQEGPMKTGGSKPETQTPRPTCEPGAQRARPSLSKCLSVGNYARQLQEYAEGLEAELIQLRAERGRIISSMGHIDAITAVAWSDGADEIAAVRDIARAALTQREGGEDETG